MAKKLKPARTEREWWAILKSDDKSFIRSMEDWKKAIANPKTNPLKGCDDNAMGHFTKSLKFVNGGLGHADFREIEKRLSFFQFKKLWEQFGLSLELFADHAGFECEKKGTCSPRLTTICTSNC